MGYMELVRPAERTLKTAVEEYGKAYKESEFIRKLTWFVAGIIIGKYILR